MKRVVLGAIGELESKSFTRPSRSVIQRRPLSAPLSASSHLPDKGF
jgi:hypothetical protein